ncbi:MAG TPA: ComEA family DNA-binding protein [Dehalococcoidia bacterium]|nr:ComEA family DNA-binding protein [Dehalococcoidia bacterium]
MPQVGFKKCRLVIAALAAAAILIGEILTASGCDGTPPIEISLPETTATGQITQVYIGGEVNNPGFYPLQDGDTIESLVQAAGGIIDGFDSSHVELNIAQADDQETPQKININRAEAWLLEALPGIGEVKAQAIISYRQQNGLFHSTNELLNVDGIGESTLENIGDLITVAD